jgi:intracellular multiplication protein IcmK
MAMTEHSAGKLGVFLLAALCVFSGMTGFTSPAHAHASATPAFRSLDSAAPSASSALPAPAAGALPVAPEVSPRSPGMQLPADSGAGDPFAAPKETVKSPEEVENEIRTEAFGAAITGLLPLKPPEIRKLLEHFDETRQAVEIPIYPYPTPEVSAQTISLDPGAAPAEIKVAVGHVTTLTMLDNTGAPWPIQDLAWAGNFEIVKPNVDAPLSAADGANIVRITPLSEFTYGNISIRLVKLKTPVTFILRTHRDKVHYRFDARIPDYGPFAQMPLIEGGGPTLVAGDAVQNAILDGIPPSDAVRMAVSGVDSRTSAYKVNHLTYVRTPLTLLSPGWSSSVSSADGMSVYTVTNAPVLLLSDRGNVVQARLSDRTSSNEKSETDKTFKPDKEASP